MEMPLLAAALIVKDEERYLPDCLAALNEMRPLLSQICIYDTGSSDRTIEIAREAGAEVEHGYWDEDFSRARNAAIAMTHAKWVLIVDADERVRADQGLLRRSLRQALTHEGVGRDALHVTVRDIRASGHVNSFLSRRLLRPARAQYRNAVHEDVYALRGELSEAELPQSHIVFDHIGYVDAPAVRAKTERNEAIAQQAIDAANPEDTGNSEELVRLLVDRGRSRAAQGDTGGALGDYERVRAMSSSRNYRTWGLEMYTDLLINLGRFEEAEAVIGELRAEGVTRADYCDWLTARLLCARGDVREGLDLLRKIEVVVSVIQAVAPPERLLAARMKAAAHVGEFEEAAAYLVALMAVHGEVQPGYGKLLLALTRALPQDALTQLIIESDRGHLSAIAAELDTAGSEGHRMAAQLRSAIASAAGAPIGLAPQAAQKVRGNAFTR